MADLNFYNVGNLNSYLSTLQSHPGSLAGAGSSLMTSFGLYGFSIGILYQNENYAGYNDDDTVYYKSFSQFIPAVGTGFRFFDGMIRVGYSLQWVNQRMAVRLWRLPLH